MKFLTLTSSFPNYEDSYEGTFIGDLVRIISRKNIHPVVLAPHFPTGKLHECWGNIDINRFRYFFPTRYERLAYGSGFVINIRNDYLAFAQIIPFFLAQVFSSLCLVVKEKIDLVHSHWLLPQGLTGAILHSMWRTPHVATVHGSDLNLIKKSRILRVFCRFILRHSDAITVNSRYMKQQLLLVDPTSGNKIVIIPMGVDPGRFCGRGDSDKKKEYHTDHLILGIGRLIDWKGMNYLIEALPEVLKIYPDTRLLVIGVGPELENLKAKTNELDLKNSVSFVGNVSIEDLPSYYHAADVVVLPSIDKAGRTEGLGVVLLEAMAAGCPVIGSNVGGIPDVISDGKNGFLVPEQNPKVLAEKIVLILSNTGLSEKFRKAGLARIQATFSWETVAGQFLEVYARVLRK